MNRYIKKDKTIIKFTIFTTLSVQIFASSKNMHFAWIYFREADQIRYQTIVKWTLNEWKFYEKRKLSRIKAFQIFREDLISRFGQNSRNSVLLLPLLTVIVKILIDYFF